MRSLAVALGLVVIGLIAAAQQPKTEFTLRLKDTHSYRSEEVIRAEIKLPASSG